MCCYLPMVYTDDDDGSSSISDDDDLQLDHHNSRVTDNFVLNYSFEDCFSMWSSLVDGTKVQVVLQNIFKYFL